MRYIHRNPVEAKLVTKMEDWEYSNYPDWTGIRNGKLFDKEFIIERFGSVPNYIDFVTNENEFMKHLNFEEVCLE